MDKVYISSSKHSSPKDCAFVEDFIRTKTNYQIKTFNGGRFEPSDVDDCYKLIIIPPLHKDSNEDEIYVGRGQNDMACRALKKNTEVIVFFNSNFYCVSIVEYIGENWQNEYGLLHTGIKKNSLNEIAKGNIEVTKEFTLNKNKVLDKKYNLLPAAILFPTRYK